MPSVAQALAGACVLLARLATASTSLEEGALPSYHYGAAIPVECMNRST
jgi:hypothetical protein